MFEKNATTLRDVFLVLALLAFAIGVIEIVMFGLGLSSGIGIKQRFGVVPESFAHGAIFCALASIAFGVIHLGRTRP